MFLHFFGANISQKKIMNDIEGLSIPQCESDVPVELNTIPSKGYVGVKRRLLTSKRGTSKLN